MTTFEINQRIADLIAAAKETMALIDKCEAKVKA